MCNTEDCLHYDYVRLAWDIGFTFEEYDTKHGFDISVIGLVDVEKVAKERDIPTVVKHIPTLLNFRLDNEMGKVLEPNFIKLFRLSQLAIQYLIFCKKYLDSTVALIKNDLISMNDEKTDLEEFLDEVKVENETIKRKYDELKATLSTSIFKCEECSKTFYSEEYLLAHIRRRHQVHNVHMQTEADKLQLEIKELKQRLNNTERLILKEELKLDGKDNQEEKMSPKECGADKEKELESVEPNNDAILENTIQYKFEQLKNHIETEINSLKDEDFYKGICEKYLKERVAKNLSVTTIKDSESQLSQSFSINLVESNTKPTQSQVSTKDFSTNFDITGSTNIKNDKDTSNINENNKIVETSTQTECKTISEGTSMSPQPTPRKLSKPQSDGDHESIGNPVSTQSITTTAKDTSSNTINVNETSENESSHNSHGVMKSIEEKLAKEVEYQRETLEHILDLKLSGSLNKMEAQMTAFWQKLNAWENNLSAKSSSVPSMNVHSEPVRNINIENGNLHVLQKQNSVGGLETSSPIHKPFPRVIRNVHDKSVQPIIQNQNSKNTVQVVPKALPRNLHQKPPGIVAPRTKINSTSEKKNDLSRFLDSSEEEDDDQQDEDKKTESEGSETITKSNKSDESTSEEETPSNIKPTDSFKKRLDQALLQRLKPQMNIKVVKAEVNHPPPQIVDKMAAKPIKQDGAPSKLRKMFHLEPIDRKSSPTKSESKSDSEEPNETNERNQKNYKAMKRRLKRHVEESVNQKLKDIGVSPHWKCLPEKSFHKAMEIVEHQANLSKKNIHDFYRIRKNIERTIDKEIDKSNEVRKRRATVNLPLRINTDTKIESAPSESHSLSESSVDIPLQRISGRPTIKATSRRTSIQSESTNSSPLKVKQVTGSSNQQFTKNNNLRQETTNITIIPSKQITRQEPEVTSSSTVTTIGNVQSFSVKKSSDITTSSTLAEVAKSSPEKLPPPQNTKKKVLFNLESDTELSEQQAPTKLPEVQTKQNKKDIAFFFEQEKSKLNQNKQSKPKQQGNLELHTGSESSDWDISDIT